ncbi:MAG: hypothetical protein AAFU86_17335, partial [Pseudomonadota bacterium]
QVSTTIGRILVALCRGGRRAFCRAPGLWWFDYAPQHVALSAKCRQAIGQDTHILWFFADFRVTFAPGGGSLGAV